MFDTLITVIGNVATKPNRRDVATGAVTDFRVASTSRRYDKAKDGWVDGDELFIKVSCWRALGDNVFESINVGDPVIVRGRLYSRRITESASSAKYVYEVNAQSVGHDLSRGVSQFARRYNRPPLNPRQASEFDAIVEGIGKNGLPTEVATAAALPAILPLAHILFGIQRTDAHRGTIQHTSARLIDAVVEALDMVAHLLGGTKSFDAVGQPVEFLTQCECRGQEPGEVLALDEAFEPPILIGELVAVGQRFAGAGEIFEVSAFFGFANRAIDCRLISAHDITAFPQSLADDVWILCARGPQLAGRDRRHVTESAA